MACARAVRIYRGIPNVVGIKRFGRTDSRVDIMYQSTDGENLPVEGVASCTFAAGPERSTRIVGATIDGEIVDIRDIANINQTIAAEAE